MLNKINKLFITFFVLLALSYIGYYFINDIFRATLPKSSKATLIENKYNDTTYGYNFNLHKNWNYHVISADMNRYAKTIYFPNKSKNEKYTLYLTKNDTTSLDVLKTIAPISIEVSKVPDIKVNLNKLITDSCGIPSRCDESTKHTIKISGTDAVSIKTNSPFESEKIFFIKNYDSTGLKGPYLYTITVRTDLQTRGLFDITDVKSEFLSIKYSFKFVY